VDDEGDFMVQRGCRPRRPAGDEHHDGAENEDGDPVEGTWPTPWRAATRARVLVDRVGHAAAHDGDEHHDGAEVADSVEDGAEVVDSVEGRDQGGGRVLVRRPATRT